MKVLPFIIFTFINILGFNGTLYADTSLSFEDWNSNGCTYDEDTSGSEPNPNCPCCVIIANEIMQIILSKYPTYEGVQIKPGYALRYDEVCSTGSYTDHPNDELNEEVCAIIDRYINSLVEELRNKAIEAGIAKNGKYIQDFDINKLKSIAKWSLISWGITSSSLDLDNNLTSPSSPEAICQKATITHCKNTYEEVPECLINQTPCESATSWEQIDNGVVYRYTAEYKDKTNNKYYTFGTIQFSCNSGYYGTPKGIYYENEFPICPNSDIENNIYCECYPCPYSSELSVNSLTSDIGNNTAKENCYFKEGAIGSDESGEFKIEDGICSY